MGYRLFPAETNEHKASIKWASNVKWPFRSYRLQGGSISLVGINGNMAPSPELRARQRASSLWVSMVARLFAVLLDAALGTPDKGVSVFYWSHHAAYICGAGRRAKRLWMSWVSRPHVQHAWVKERQAHVEFHNLYGHSLTTLGNFQSVDITTNTRTVQP